MMPDPKAMPTCSILVRGTWPGYLGGGRLSAEKWRTATVAALDRWQIAGLAAPDIDLEASPDGAGPAAEAATRRPCPTRISGASISSVLGAGMVRQECGVPRAAEMKLEPETNKQKQKEVKLWRLSAEAAASGAKLEISPVKALVVHTTLFHASSWLDADLYSR